MSRSDYAGARRHFDRAVAAFPDFGAAHYALALAYRRLGRAAERAERSKAAEVRRLLAGGRGPCRGPDTGGEGGCRRDTEARDPARVNGDVPAAIAAHEKALALSPTLVQARVNLITLYGRAGRWSDAEAQYREALAAGRNISEAHANYAQVLLAQRRAAEAIPVFRAALDSNPADGAARNGLGLALEMAGDAAARSRLTGRRWRCATLRPARFNYGRALVTAGRPQDAIPEFEKILEPEDAETPRYLFALAAARVRVGDIAAGRTQATAALSMARRYGQEDLAASIERDLARLK